MDINGLLMDIDGLSMDLSQDGFMSDWIHLKKLPENTNDLRHESRCTATHWW